MPAKSNRQITFAEALREGLDQCMAKDASVYVMGLGVPDPKGIFGTTLDLHKKYGDERVLDMPTSENAMTGIATGSALVGMRPVMTHQRVDFFLLCMDQIVNQAAKWHYMFGGKMKVPMVIRLIIGRGWGQGPQHSQTLQSWFAHIPGLKVVMPSTPYDAKGLLISSIEDNNPVIFLEHRWLHNVKGEVPEEIYHVPLGKSRLIRKGKHVTIVSMSYLTLEALKAADQLQEMGIEAEVIDLRTLNPLDDSLMVVSVKKTGRLIVADPDWKNAGMSAEIVSRAAEKCFDRLKKPPVRLTFPEHPTPTSWALSGNFYPRAVEMMEAAGALMGKKLNLAKFKDKPGVKLDVPDASFSGPF